MKCQWCGFEGDSLDFTTTMPEDEHTVVIAPVKVCPKCRRIV